MAQGAGAGGPGRAGHDQELTGDQLLDRVNTHSRPSDLRITDLRVASLTGVPFRSTIIRIDTNQGISGYGEVRDGASRSFALLLKARLVGENPCNVDKLFRAIKQFGHHGRQGGGVCGVEMALMDLAGKAYGVPAYALAGGKFRDRVLCYADTPNSPDPQVLAERLVGRRKLGYQFLKMDVGINLLWDVPGALIAPPGAREQTTTMHPFTGIRVTDKGVDLLAEHVATVREAVGYDIPLAVDHFGHIGVDSCLRVGRALEPFALAWLEDLVPWQFTAQWRELTTALSTPTCTGEDIYLAENFKPLLEAEAIRIVHPDPATSGGILETKRVGDLAEEHGVAMALHMAASPIATLASAHIAAATHNFLALEHHAVDVPWWSDLVTGLPSPLIEDGHITVPDKPGLGFDDINEELFREHLDPAFPSFFEPSEVWDTEVHRDRLWS
ncbi:L-alanine-DL-glutamate epimerase [Actinopolymorpha cephalotaxi]|uniref:L-alanine-DL-glutamate epimerase n=1 Tax=Actinopolymorpha cephalotaxi TaxID=504797 RepID=A0A1I2WF76_9ACTN|nr:mandelate racemase/muconate lactonizing enzyme family protein [Actinopolymorpha cephalotaxi]NYH82647.1 L-alanine-DL-glutamate epimerase-like enolase superfamily enzyme [Actinopolymorpha cephalotaxi]SFG98976.1 L-alanine-DL-glutamate epimerase [Actinopolymorpha cephalotaxi]